MEKGHKKNLFHFTYFVLRILHENLGSSICDAARRNLPKRPEVFFPLYLPHCYA